MGSHGGCASQAKANGRDGASKVLGVPEHSDGASHGGCASQDKGQDGASEAEGQGQGRDGASSSNGDAASQGQGQDRSVPPDAEPNTSLRELQTDYGFQFRVQDDSDGEEDSSHRDVSSTGSCASQDQGRDGASKAQGQGRDGESSSNGDIASQGQAKDQEGQGQGGEDSDSEDSLPPLSPLPPERGPNYGAPVQTDPLSSTRFSSLVLLLSKMIDLLLREQQGHEDSSPTRSQVAAALNVLSSGGESQHNVHRQDGQRLASPSGGEPQQVAAALDVLSSVENVD